MVIVRLLYHASVVIIVRPAYPVGKGRNTSTLKAACAIAYIIGAVAAKFAISSSVPVPVKIVVVVVISIVSHVATF